jgi:hypothetical protein
MENKKLYILQYNYTGEIYVFSTATAALEYAIQLLRNEDNYEENKDYFEEVIVDISTQAAKYHGEFDSDYYATCYSAPFIE